MSEMSRIVNCRVLEPYEIELEFDDGFSGRLDLKDELSGPVFGPLKDPDFFRRVRVEDDTIRWSNGADFDPNVLRYWCESGGVKSQEETDEWFARALAATAAGSA